MTEASRGGLPVEVELGPYVIIVARAFGPRVLGLRHRAGPQMFASHDQLIDHPGGGVFRSHGGHRLWAAPEVPSVTYVPDDRPCEVRSDGTGVVIIGPPDAAGLGKQVTVTLDGAELTVEHRLTNHDSAPVSVAPWAITQMRLGGLALLPVTAPVGEALQADRSVVLWPYTNLVDRRLSWKKKAVIVRGEPGPRFKIGSGPVPGRIGYVVDGWLFVKTFPAAGDGDYPDRGALGQVFVADVFCEVESVGALTVLDRNGSVGHLERWALEPCDGVEAAYRRLVEP